VITEPSLVLRFDQVLCVLVYTSCRAERALRRREDCYVDQTRSCSSRSVRLLQQNGIASGTCDLAG